MSKSIAKQMYRDIHNLRLFPQYLQREITLDVYNYLVSGILPSGVTK